MMQHEGAAIENNMALADQPFLIRVLTQMISIIFHPIFVPVYVTAFLLFVHPFLFSGYDESRKLRLLATVVVNLTLLPAITVFLSWRLGFISGIHLETQRDRIIPLAAAMIFYFWCWFVLRNFSEIPELFRDFLQGSFLTIIAAWLANIKFKISLHGLAIGGMLAFMFILTYGADGGSGWHLVVALLAAGIVCSSRMVMLAHRPFEIYAGLVMGAICQLLALMV